MKQIEIETENTRAIATYKPLFRHEVEIELISPYKGLKLEFAKADDECNLFDDAQAEAFVKESLVLLVKQIKNVIRYRSVYQTINEKYKTITDVMWTVLKAMDMPPRDKFRYHCELQKRVQEEIFSTLRELIPEINEGNQVEFLICPYQLSKILTAI